MKSVGTTFLDLKKALLISLLLVLAGCGGALKNSWTNFRAYYNTYYNAKESFRAGLQKVQEQTVELNVNEPIRVHRPPVGSGDQDFQSAIEKGAQILRKFPESKWMDETLELIGKSYYYRQEYYSALQKFEEQYNVAETPELRQRAVIWKGRVLLDLDLFNEGIVFLESELSELSGEWSPEMRGEAEVLLAEHHVELQNWQQASQYLSDAVPSLPVGPLKARAFFLYGQVLELNKEFGEAAFAYNQTQQNRPDFELLYWANYKQAEVLRKMGALDQAFAIYDRMRKDDKNVDRLADIYYQIARTEEARGNIELARDIYKEVLNNDTYQLARKTQADIYYRLAEIYNNYYDKFDLAAAYYDSSSSMQNSQQQAGVLEEQQDTETLAKAYGQYNNLRSQIARQDSLLWLGSLPQSRLDSVIAVIENRRLQQMKQQKSRETEQNVITNVGPTQSSGTDERTTDAYGFLNYKHSRMLTEARVQFRAVWGDRALVDNWRRIEAVRSGGGQSRSTEDTISQSRAPEQAKPKEDIAVDITQIPLTGNERQQARDRIAASRYELGNLFLLTLQQPDSAAHYFRTVAEQHPEHELVPRALYSLYELYNSQGEPQGAQQWADSLVQKYPDSRYSRQLKQRLAEESGLQPSPDTTGSSISDKAGRIISSKTSTEEIAKELRSLALANKESSAASRVHYEAIRHYIKLAKERDTVASYQPQLPADSLATDSLAADSLSQSPSAKIVYQGAYWDSVRTVLSEHQQNFSGPNSANKVKKLSDELGEMQKDTAAVSRQSGKDSSVPSCKELGIQPEIKQGMDQFLSSVEYPDNLAEVNLSGSVEYAFTITAAGQVEEYELISKKTNMGIEEAFEKAFEARFSFAPLSLDENITKVRCHVEFPISR